MGMYSQKDVCGPLLLLFNKLPAIVQHLTINIILPPTLKLLTCVLHL